MPQTKFSFQRGSMTVTSPGLFNAGTSASVGAQALINQMRIRIVSEEEEATEWSPPNNARQIDPGLISEFSFTASGFAAQEYKPNVESWKMTRSVTRFTSTFPGQVIVVDAYEYDFEWGGTVGSKVEFSLRCKWDGSGTLTWT